MSDVTKLIELLRAASVKGGMCDVAAALIERQADRIAELEAQLAHVAPAVDAQPVAWLIERSDASPEATATREYADLTRRNGSKVTPLYASPQSEGLRKDAIRREALEEAAKAVGALHEKIGEQEIIGFDAWSAAHLALDNAAWNIRALSEKESGE